MFSSKLTRAANRATAITSASPSPAQRTASQCFATATQQRRPHQRRQSSSKASCPPDSSNKPAPAAKAAESADNTAHASPAEKTPKRASRMKRTQVEKSAKGKEEANQFAGLPAVPDTRHVGEKDFWLSTFFSLHHPLSLNNPIPPPASEETFNSIFESKPQMDVWENGNSAEKRPEDVIIALQETIESLEGTGAAGEEAGVRWEVLQESSSNNGTKHLDGPPKPRTIDDLVNQFRPFQPPPPPQAFPLETKASEKKRARSAKPKSKRFQTTIEITESTAADGHKTYTASQGPMVQIANTKESNTVDVTASTSTRQPHQPFLQRAWRKHQAHLQSQRKNNLSVSTAVSNPLRHIRRAPTPGHRNTQMRLISVKRQRKLKMKKHKYKKLMKRTRNLRRRLDRN